MKAKGFSLVEIMVAMVILSLLATGLFSVIVSSRYLVGRSRKRFQAIEIARGRIEQCRRYVRGDSDAFLNPNSTWTAWDGVTFAPFSVRYRVDPAPGAFQYRKITCQVQWSESSI